MGRGAWYRLTMTAILRPLDPDRDGAALHAIFGDEESCVFLTREATQTVEETIALLKKWSSVSSETDWAIVEHPEGPALGRATLFSERDPEVWEAGIMLRPDAYGRGLALSAIQQGLKFIFEQKKARRVFVDIDPDNAPSLRLFEKLGFQREGVLRAEWRTHIGVRDAVIMGLLADERSGF